jgi:hypothetical protein
VATCAGPMTPVGFNTSRSNAGTLVSPPKAQERNLRASRGEQSQLAGALLQEFVVEFFEGETASLFAAKIFPQLDNL